MERQRKPTAVTGLQIIEYLALHPDGARLGEIAAATKMDGGQTHRILSALADDGWVFPTAEKGIYALATRVLRLGAIYAGGLDLAEYARPYMEKLQEKTGETVHLGELRGEMIVCVGLKLSAHQLTVFTKVGDVWPLSGTSMGHAIRAAALNRTGRDLISGVPPAEVMQALHNGYGRDFGRYRKEVESISAPILNLHGIEIGALSVAGPSSRIGEREIEEFGRLVATAASNISERMGCVAPWPQQCHGCAATSFNNTDDDAVPPRSTPPRA